MDSMENIQGVAFSQLFNFQKLLSSTNCSSGTHFLRKKSAVSVPIGRPSSSEVDDSDSLDLSHMSSLSPSDSCEKITQPPTSHDTQAKHCSTTTQLIKPQGTDLQRTSHGFTSGTWHCCKIIWGKSITPHLCQQVSAPKWPIMCPLSSETLSTDWYIKVLRPTWHKVSHFRGVLPSQSPGIVLKKLNLTKLKQTQEQVI